VLKSLAWVGLDAAQGNGALRYLFEDYAFDTDRRELHRGAHPVPLPPQVFDLLDYLIRNRQRVVSKDDLIASVWTGRVISDSALTTRINAARNAIGDSGVKQRLIKTLPRKGFRFVGAVREEYLPESVTTVGQFAESARPTLIVPSKPSIAVLPFTNWSGDAEQEYFADGITEDIITELSRFSELFVIARNSSFQYKGKSVDVREIGRELGVRYVLEGSVRRSDRLRIAAQLVDAATGTHHWAERYDRRLDDMFTIQDEVARAIVTILVAHVNKAEAQRTLLKPPASWHAYDYYMRGAETLSSYWSSVKAKDLYQTRLFCERALTIDPNYARAYATLSTTYLIAWLNRLDGDHLNPVALDRAYQLARKAVQLDPNLPQAHASFGAVLAWKRQHDASVAEFEKTIAVNPNFVDWRFAIALVYAGNPKRAIQILKTYMRLDPFYAPLAPHWLGFAHYMLRQYSKALPPLRECAARAPNYRAVHVWLAATYVRLRLPEEARAEAAEVLRIDPNFTIDGSAKPILAFKCPRDAEHCIDALRGAGLPER
jgi:adenylate cyclase